MCKMKDVARYFKELVGNCKNIAVREMNTVVKAGFYDTLKLILVTLFFFLASTILIS